MAAGAALAAVNVATGSSQLTSRPKRRSTVHPGDDHRGVCAISSANGERATDKAMAMIRNGADPVDAIVAGVNIVENDPNDRSVGYGGLPNEEGVIELDSSVMHGPTHKAGAVAALRNIMNPASVALKVLRRTDHVLIVGDGALKFARAHGFEETDLMTPETREIWLRWKENLNPNDDWLDDDQRDLEDRNSARVDLDAEQLFTYGTIHCSAVNDGGDLSGVTTTSGLSYKIPGRVGDSPIVGAGMFVDNHIGAAGATGRGEAVIQNCGSFAIVQEMERGATPTEACLTVLERIARNTRQKRLLDSEGRPNFNVVFYAVRKDGAYGSASMLSGSSFAVHDGETNRLLDSAFLFERG